MTVPKPKQISDEEILEWINSGDLCIANVESSDPILLFRGRVILPELTSASGKRVVDSGTGNKRYSWRLRDQGRRRRIVRNRLVWMFVKREVIGDDFTIDHSFEGRFHDGISNLSKLANAAHYEKHYGKSPSQR